MEALSPSSTRVHSPLPEEPPKGAPPPPGSSPRRVEEERSSAVCGASARASFQPSALNAAEIKVCGVSEAIFRDAQFVLDYVAALSISAAFIQGLNPIVMVVVVVVAVASHFFNPYEESEQQAPTTPRAQSPAPAPLSMEPRPFLNSLPMHTETRARLYQIELPASISSNVRGMQACFRNYVVPLLSAIVAQNSSLSIRQREEHPDYLVLESTLGVEVGPVTVEGQVNRHVFRLKESVNAETGVEISILEGTPSRLTKGSIEIRYNNDTYKIDRFVFDPSEQSISIYGNKVPSRDSSPEWEDVAAQGGSDSSRVAFSAEVEMDEDFPLLQIPFARVSEFMNARSLVE